MTINYNRAARTNPHKVHQHEAVRQKLIKNGAISLVSNPVKSDYPEVTLEHNDLVSVGVLAADPNIPTKATRTVPFNHLATIMSARSKRELRQMIENAGASILTTIQVNDQGKYFVYVDIGVSPTARAVDCMEETPQKLSDIDYPEDDCPPDTKQSLADLPESSKEC